MIDKQSQFKNLLLDIKSCTKCPLSKCRDKPSLPRGDPRAPLLLIGDMPRSTEHREGLVFQGISKKNAEKLLNESGISPNMVCYSNLLMCYPGKGEYFPETDAPLKCFGHTQKLLDISKPLVIGLLGKEAAAWILFRGLTTSLEDLSEHFGKFYRRRLPYGETIFIVLPNALELRKPEGLFYWDTHISTFKQIKDIVIRKQNNQPLDNILILDLKKEVEHKRKEQLGFKFKLPSNL